MDKQDKAKTIADYFKRDKPEEEKDKDKKSLYGSFKDALLARKRKLMGEDK